MRREESRQLNYVGISYSNLYVFHAKYQATFGKLDSCIA